MNRKSKILLWIFILLILLSVSATFYKTVILQDFVVYNEIDCDPSSENCFVWTCNPVIDGADACTRNPDDDTWYYKIAYRNAQNINLCNSEENETCDPYACTEFENDCMQITCSNEALIEYERDGKCSGPDYYGNTNEY